MNEVLTRAEMEAQFDGEWVLIANPKLDELRPALDTGATETSISRFMLTQAGYRFSNALTVPVVMGSGVVSIPLVTLDSLGALGQTQAGLIVQAYTLPPSLPIDGVLGLDFIRRGRLVVDFRTGQISLT